MGTHCLTGSRLGIYQVQTLLGSADGTESYRGIDLNLHRPVTIKVQCATGGAPDRVGRFRQEAFLLARLQHPNIVRIYDFGEQSGLVYMVQEALPEPTLAQRLAKLNAHALRLDRQEILAITSQVADALDAAHVAGIVHRNVKPGSIMWNAAGILVLTNFGIARDTLTHANLTQAGVILGTPQYLSPEQALGRPPTPASDIYALGVVLYELLAGTPPFTGATQLAIALHHIQDPPPPLGPLRPDLPPAVEAIVQRALAKDPEKRFSSAGELARALVQAWSAVPIVAGNQPPCDIHSQATQVWMGVPAARTPPAAPNRPVSESQPLFARTQPPVPAISCNAAGMRHAGSRVMLPVLALLLVVLLLGGVLLAWRGETTMLRGSRHGTALTTSSIQSAPPLGAARAAIAP